MVEVGKIGDKTLVLDGRYISIFRGRKLINRWAYMGYLLPDGNAYIYRRKVHIKELSGNTLTDYQVKIVLGAGDPIFAHARSAGEDIRFCYYPEEEMLSYWIEKFDPDAEEAIIWVKVPSIPANSEIEIYCYSDDTEILTEEGWMSLREVVENKKHIKVATLNPEKDVVEYHYPTRYFKLPYKGKLFRQKGRGIDICVTPNHRLWVRTKTKDKKFRFIKAEDCPRYVEYRRDFPYEGEEVEYFVLPSYENKYTDRLGRERTIKRKEKKFRMDDFLAFFGVWLAEGSLRGKNSIVISQNNPEKCEIIKSIIEKLGYKAYYYRKKTNTGIFLIHDVQLNQWLRQFGKAGEKYIPKEFKQLSKRQLRILLEAMVLGDGSHYKNSQSFYYATTSKQLANEVYEVAIKAGYIASQRRREDGCYIIEISESQKTPCVNQGNDNREWIEYNGYVYCIEVPNHIIYVRRNGKACWCGNCYYGNPTVGSASDVSATFIRVIDGLVACWHLDEGSGAIAHDSSGNGYDLAIHGAIWVDGVFGKALSFDGADDYADVDMPQDFCKAGSSFSIELRVKSSDTTTEEMLIGNYPDGGVTPFFSFYTESGGCISFFHRDTGGTEARPISTTNVMDGSWHHLVGVRDVDAGRSYIYVDKVKEDDVADNTGDCSNTYNVTLMLHHNDRYHAGVLDEIRIYSKALSDEEISDLCDNYGYTTTNYPGKVLVRKYTEPEPSVSVGAEE